MLGFPKLSSFTYVCLSLLYFIWCLDTEEALRVTMAITSVKIFSFRSHMASGFLPSENKIKMEYFLLLLTRGWIRLSWDTYLGANCWRDRVLRWVVAQFVNNINNDNNNIIIIISQCV